MIRKPTLTAGYPFTGNALIVLEPYATKAARTVLRGRKLPGGINAINSPYENFRIDQLYSILFCASEVSKD